MASTYILELDASKDFRLDGGITEDEPNPVATLKGITERCQ